MKIAKVSPVWNIQIVESKLSKTAFEEEVLRTNKQKKEATIVGSISFPGSLLFPSLFALRKQRDPGTSLREDHFMNLFFALRSQQSLFLS